MVQVYKIQNTLVSPKVSEYQCDHRLWMEIHGLTNIMSHRTDCRREKWIYRDTRPRRKTHLQQPHVCICKHSAGRLYRVWKSLFSSKITTYSSWSQGRTSQKPESCQNCHGNSKAFLQGTMPELEARTPSNSKQPFPKSLAPASNRWNWGKWGAEMDAGVWTMLPLPPCPSPREAKRDTTGTRGKLLTPRSVDCKGTMQPDSKTLNFLSADLKLLNTALNRRTTRGILCCLLL